MGDWKSIKINGIAKIEKFVADESYHRNTEGGQCLTHKQFSEIRNRMFEAINDLTYEEIKVKLRGALAYTHS